MVAFGLAPAVVAYQWGVVRIAEYGYVWGRIGWLATFFYAACAAIRLARFNARSATADKRFFEGLPSPSAAALLAGFVWMLNELQREGLRALVLAFVVATVAGLLMVSRFPYLQRQGFQPEPAPAVRVPAARAARLRAGGLEPARDAVRAVRTVRAVGPGALGLAQVLARSPRRGPGK